MYWMPMNVLGTWAWHLWWVIYVIYIKAQREEKHVLYFIQEDIWILLEEPFKN